MSINDRSHRGPEADADGADAFAPSIAPGRRTLTAQLPRVPSASAVKSALPKAQPQLIGPKAPGIELTSSAAASLGGDVQQAMEHKVVTEFVHDQEKAAAAAAAAMPKAEQQTRGAQAIAADAKAGGGSSLPGNVRQAMDGVVPGADLDGVRLHENNPAVADIQARGAAMGNNIFLSGRADVDSASGRGLLAEELAHTAQARGRSQGSGVTLGGTSNAAEHDAARVRGAVERGASAPEPSESHDATTIQRGEAGVHMNDITMPGLGVDDHHYDNRGQNSGDLSGDQQRALQVYSGNFMSDFSQANAPTVINALAHMPSGRGNGSPGVGTQGAGQIVNGIIRALAVLELGSDAAQVVVAPNIEMYEGERHMDHTMGTDQSAYSVSRNGVASGNSVSPESGASGPNEGATAARCVATTTPSIEQLAAAGITTPSQITDHARRASDTNEQHEGSAVPGLQFENPTLYQASPSGMTNLIYNSTEAAKQSYRRAAIAAAQGNVRLARMHVGYADHPIQDYYSHTNFIEVALNRYINDAMASRGPGLGGRTSGATREGNAEGREELLHHLEESGPHREGGTGGAPALVSPQWVAPLFDSSITVNGPDGRPEQRDVITSGTFGSKDTMVSIAHTFMPLIPKLHESLMRAIDEFAGLVEAAPPEAKSQALLDRLTSASREGEAFTILLGAMGDAGVGIPVPSDISLGTYPQAISPGIFGDPWTVNLPDGTLDVTWGAGIPIMGAIDGFLGVYGTFKELKEGLSSVANYIQLTTVKNLLDAAWKAVHQKFTTAVKQGMTSLIATLVASITAELQGKEMSVEDYANAASANLDELLEHAHHALHEQEETTSMSDRLASGDLHGLTVGGDETRASLERQVGPVTGSGTESDPWVPVNPLPPSHSEISKDHPPHDPSDHHHEHEGSHHYHDEDHGAAVNEREAREMVGLGDPEHKPELPDHDGGGMGADDHGSPFFGISNALGREAMRHIYREVDAMLADIAATRPGQESHLISAEAAARRDGEMENQDHGAILDMAQEQANSEAERARQQGFRHMQGDRDGVMQQHPALERIANLVDLFISHPDAATWWVGVVDNYVGAHPDQVYHHILRRNEQAAARRTR